MKRFICAQNTYTEVRSGTSSNITISLILRNVGASNEAEAIGKFTKCVNGMDHPPGTVKLDVLCYILSGAETGEEELFKID